MKNLIIKWLIRKLVGKLVHLDDVAWDALIVAALEAEERFVNGSVKATYVKEKIVEIWGKIPAWLQNVILELVVTYIQKEVK